MKGKSGIKAFTAVTIVVLAGLSTASLQIDQSSTVLPLSLLPVKAATRTWTVDDNGPADFKTIQAAVNASSSGDVINVKAGLYLENVVVNKAVTLLGEGSSQTVLDGNGSVNAATVTASNVVIKGFLIRNNASYDAGVRLHPTASNCIISDNTIFGNEYGVRLDFSTGNTISHNYILNSTSLGVFLAYSTNNWVTSNHIEGTHNYAIFISSSNSNIISANDITNNGLGITGSDCSNNVIAGNNLTNNESGVDLSTPNYNTISYNHIANNSWAGISLGVSFNSDLQNVNNNVIIGNNVTNNGDYGIWLANSNGNVMYENSVTDNKYGIYINNASDNVAYHNNLFNNTNQAYSRLFINTWDNGYPSGGNYWSDYTGTDANNDGIADTPYIIDSNNQDRYPLTASSSPRLSTVQTTTFIILQPNLVGVGQTVRINMLILPPPPTSSDYFTGLRLTITRPDGTTETKGPFSTDAEGSQYVFYTPSQLGTYKLQLSCLSQFFTSSNATFLPSSSALVTLTVQQEPIASGSPSPTGSPTPAYIPTATPANLPTSTPKSTTVPNISVAPSPTATAFPTPTPIFIPQANGEQTQKNSFSTVAIVVIAVAAATVVLAIMMLRKLYLNAKQ